MKTSHERKAEALASAGEIIAAAKSGDRDLTAEETSQVNAFVDTADAAQAEIEKADAAIAAEGRLVAAQAQDAKQATRRVTASASAPTAPHAPLTARLVAEDDPKRGFTTPAEFLQAVIKLGQGFRADDRLAPLMAAAGSDEAGGYSDAYGGVLVPGGFSPNLLSVQAEADPIAAYTTKIPMGSPKVTLPARVDKDHSTSVSGGLRVYRRAEADTVTASRMKFAGVSLEATPLMGISYATEEILVDSAISFIAMLEAGFRDEFTANHINEVLNGNGVGEFLGILNSPALVSISKETGQAAATIVYENIIKMFARCWRPQMWVANRTLIPQLAILNQTVGTGGVPVWAASAVSGLPGTLLGLPIFYTEFAQTLGTKGDLMLANWSQYLEGTYEPMAQAESMHVRFVNHERAFKFYKRSDGRPWWLTAMTPRNGDSVGPFVALNTRS